MAASETGSKPGWKTTEFWLTGLTALGTLFGAIQGSIPPKWAGIISASLAGVYGLVRAFTKANVGDSAPTNPVNAKPPTA